MAMASDYQPTSGIQRTAATASIEANQPARLRLLEHDRRQALQATRPPIPAAPGPATIAIPTRIDPTTI